LILTVRCRFLRPARLVASRFLPEQQTISSLDCLNQDRPVLQERAFKIVLFQDRTCPKAVLSRLDLGQAAAGKQSGNNLRRDHPANNHCDHAKIPPV
jgi:hypothetical protein